MSSILILIVAVLYLVTAVDLGLKGQYGMSLAFLAYSISNIGLFLATRGV